MATRTHTYLMFSLVFALSLSALIACGNQTTPTTTSPDLDIPTVDPNPGGGGSGSGGNDWTGPAIYVSINGSDTSDCGDPDHPCRTIQKGVNQSAAGMAVLVKAGEYHESFIYMKSGVRVISADGPLAASIYSGDRSAVRLEQVQGAAIDGFEIRGDWNQGPQGDGLVRVLDASGCEIHNCVIYDAPNDCDLIKVSGAVDGLLIENVVAFNPGQRDPSIDPCGNGAWYQENIDIFGRGLNGTSDAEIRNVVIRGCWLFHTADHGGDWLLYSKINCENVLYENNVFGPSAGGGCGNAAVGIGTEEAGIPDPTQHVVRGAIVRNNIFVGCKGDAALAVMNSDDVWVYNNTFWGNSGSKLRAVLELRGNRVPVGNTWIFNNIFQSNQPAASGDGRLIWVREGGAGGVSHDYNLSDGNVATSDLDLSSEAHGVVGAAAGLSAPRIPSTAVLRSDRVLEIARDFALSAQSPAKGAGIAAFSYAQHPNWDPGVTDRGWDILQQTRSGTAWDLGAVKAP
ncbi:MAG TPA: hypothetical protein VKA63_02755 [Candidatus Krumholzibacteria bacterium]|nr:hypothetical protein [Candidatus Krumholzibacteria bacterium]